MSNRLNQDREKLLQPKRIDFARCELMNMGYDVESDDTKVIFMFKGERVTYFPYSGWHSGKSIEDGRGWDHLYKQLTK
jgi:hypothetical protein